MVNPAILNDLAKVPIQQLLRDPSKTFSSLKQLFRNWLTLDVTTLASILALFGTVNQTLSSFRDWGNKLYWWFRNFFTASISISPSDKLNRDILDWLSQNILEHRAAKVMTAQTESIYWWGYRPPKHKKPLDGKRVPVQYLPTFGSTWFLHNGNIFSVSLIHPSTGYYWESKTPQEYVAAPTGDEALLITCLSTNVAPIKKFIEDCRDFSEKQKEQFTTVHTVTKRDKSTYWSTRPPKPKRPLHTVHFDEAAKADLVKDINDYLDTETRAFYQSRGIPYRRGFLLYGPPGTGKTSLCLAIAGHYGLDLYQLHIPSLSSDDDLELLFSSLPPKSLVILEDIDAIGNARNMDTKVQVTMAGDKDGNEEDDSDDDSEDNASSTQSAGSAGNTGSKDSAGSAGSTSSTSSTSSTGSTRCTLSGLLNVIDGVASQEGRILFMTSNVAHKLDKALIRPGRIDKMIYLGEISKDSARLMFLRMYARGNNGYSADEKIDEKLENLAREFEKAIPDRKFTPAQLQGYMLKYKEDPEAAVAGISTWVADEILEIASKKAKAKKKKAEEKKAEEKKAEEKEAEEKKDEEKKAEEKKQEEDEKGAVGEASE